VDHRTGDIPKTVHTALLTDLLPSTEGFLTFNYQGTLSVFDAAGNRTDKPLPAQMETGTFFFLAGGLFETVLGDLSWNTFSTPLPDTLRAEADATVHLKVGGPPAFELQDHVVVATVHVNGVKSTSFTSPNPTSFTVFGQPPVIQGPFVISTVSGVDGRATLVFDQGGLVSSDVVRVNIEAVIPIDATLFDPLNPDFGDTTNAIPLGLWDFPSTPKELRAIETTF